MRIDYESARARECVKYTFHIYTQGDDNMAAYDGKFKWWLHGGVHGTWRSTRPGIVKTQAATVKAVNMEALLEAAKR
jgi:hypothetical protein